MLGGGVWFRVSLKPKELVLTIRRVMVTAFRWPRITANRNSFQVPMSSRMAVAAMPGEAAGHGHPEQRAQTGAAIDARGALQGHRHVREEVAQQPHDERHPERDVDEDQRRDRVRDAQ